MESTKLNSHDDSCRYGISRIASAGWLLMSSPRHKFSGASGHVRLHHVFDTRRNNSRERHQQFRDRGGWVRQLMASSGMQSAIFASLITPAPRPPVY